MSVGLMRNKRNTFKKKVQPMGTGKVVLRTRGIVQGQRNGADWENFRGSVTLPDGSSLSITITSRNGNFVQVVNDRKRGEIDGIWCEVALFPRNSNG